MCAIFCDLFIQHDLDEMLCEARLSEEKARSCMVDAARLAEELRAEQAEPVFTSAQSHRVATAAFWRTLNHEGKISPGW
jgi:hypothetical protein